MVCQAQEIHESWPEGFFLNLLCFDNVLLFLDLENEEEEESDIAIPLLMRNRLPVTDAEQNEKLDVSLMPNEVCSVTLNTLYILLH